jgi:hypothetical protein
LPAKMDRRVKPGDDTKRKGLRVSGLLLRRRS